MNVRTTGLDQSRFDYWDACTKRGITFLNIETRSKVKKENELVRSMMQRLKKTLYVRIGVRYSGFITAPVLVAWRHAEKSEECRAYYDSFFIQVNDASKLPPISTVWFAPPLTVSSSSLSSRVATNGPTTGPHRHDAAARGFGRRQSTRIDHHLLFLPTTGRRRRPVL